MMRDNMANAPRMSLSALNTSNDPDRQVRIWLLGATTIKGTVFYRVAGRFSSSGQTWQVNRRYSEFLMLRDTLIKYFSRATDTCPGCLNYLHSIQQFDFPKKHFFVSKSQLVINYRVQALRSFMNLLASWAFSNSPKCPTCGGFAFDIVRNFCLESAEAVGESNMSYIRESFQVSTFTEAGRRSSLSRRNSLTPAYSMHTPNAQRRDQLSDSNLLRNTMGGPPPDTRGRDEGAYDAFNDYLVRQPSQQTKAMLSRSAINIPRRRQSEDAPELEQAANGSSRGSRAKPLQRANSTGSGRSSQTQQPSASTTNGSFLFYQDDVDRGDSMRSSQRGHSTSGGGVANGSGAGSQRGAPPSSTGSKRGILKNWNNVPRERPHNTNDVPRDRAENDSYFSLGASSDAASLEALDQPVPANGRPSSTRGRKTRSNDARSENNSYFSLGASSGHSREDDENEYARPSSKPKPKASHYNTVDQQQQLREARYDRSQNDSYLSLGASTTSGDLEEEYHSHHPSVLPSPNSHEALYLQPPPTQKYTGKQRGRSPPPSNERRSERVRSPPTSSQRKSQRARSPPPPPSHEYDADEQPRSSRRHREPQPPSPPQQQRRRSQKKPQVIPDESFAADSFVDDRLRFDGMGPVAFVDDVSDSDDDEIDVTGLVIDSPPKPRKSKSGQDLWQPWELAKA